jgi:hypothetical protein
VSGTRRFVILSMYFQTSSRETTFAFLKVLKNKLCGNSSELQYLSVQPCDMVHESRWVAYRSRSLLTGLPRAGSGPGEKIFLGATARADQLKVFTLNWKDCQLQSDLALVWKGYFEQSIKNDTTEKDKNICNTVGPQALFWTARPW